jgi:hypothetical protein
VADSSLGLGEGHPMITDTNTDTDNNTIRQIEFDLEKAEHGMALPYDAERVRDLRKMLLEARKRKLSVGLARRRQER